MDNATIEPTETVVASAVLSILPSYAGTLMIIGVGIFTIVIAVVFNAIRKLIHKDEDNLDLAFDAGGKVSVGLTATTIVSQWTWAATLLQSSGVGSKYGISGPFWYAAGATVQILLFAGLSLKLKIRAPGAKTFLQVIKRRFGARTHKVYCGYALMTNVIVTAMLMLGGAEVIQHLVADYSIEMSTIMSAGIICGYTMVGGLGATFYASYFNTAFIFIGMFIFCYNVYFANPTSTDSLGSIEGVYNLLERLVGPEENRERSYLTMLSKQGLMFGIINIIGNFGTVFVDQAYWQSSVAAKPKDGVFGFLAGGLVWFAVPFTFATTMGLAYLALSSQEGAPLLSNDDVNAGLVPVAVASKIGGYSTLLVLLMMILMAIVSTGSAEVVAVASILVYDIYMTYLKPFRFTVHENRCALCGKAQGSKAKKNDACRCVSAFSCDQCRIDDAFVSRLRMRSQQQKTAEQLCKRRSYKHAHYGHARPQKMANESGRTLSQLFSTYSSERKAVKRALKPDYKCSVHGDFRRYQDVLNTKKSWCLLWSSLGILPLTLILQQTGVTLGWVYLFMGVMIGSAVVPVGLTLFWDRMTSNGMTLGPIGGTALGLIGWLVVASQYDGGLADFFTNTGQEWSMLVGNVMSLCFGGLITVIVSLVGNRNLSVVDRDEMWAATLDIDNPLYPWTELYIKELNLKAGSKRNNRPPLSEIEKTFKTPEKFAITGSVVLTLIFVVIWPAVTCLLGVFTLFHFYIWVIVSGIVLNLRASFKV